MLWEHAPSLGGVGCRDQGQAWVSAAEGGPFPHSSQGYGEAMPGLTSACRSCLQLSLDQATVPAVSQVCLCPVRDCWAATYVVTLGSQWPFPLGNWWSLLFLTVKFFSCILKTFMSVIPTLLTFTVNSNPINTMCHLTERASRISVSHVQQTLFPTHPALCDAGIACLCDMALPLLTHWTPHPIWCTRQNWCQCDFPCSQL